MKNNLGFLPLETFPHYYPDFNDIFTYQHQLHRQKKDMKMPKGTRKQESSFWNLSFIYMIDWRTNHPKYANKLTQIGQFNPFIGP